MAYNVVHYVRGFLWGVCGESCYIGDFTVVIKYAAIVNIKLEAGFLFFPPLSASEMAANRIIQNETRFI